MSDTNDNNEAPEGAAPETPAVADPAQGLKAEIASLKDQLLRAFAETENVRKRGERERADVAQYGIAKFARDLLSVADNLRRALDAAPKEMADDVKNLFEGIAATERELANVFERHGIKALDPKGQKFDPNLHQAIAEVAGSGQPSGTVVAVAQTGYMIGERLLRAAMVSVARGDGPAVAKQPGASLDTTA